MQKDVSPKNKTKYWLKHEHFLVQTHWHQIKQFHLLFFSKKSLTVIEFTYWYRTTILITELERWAHTHTQTVSEHRVPEGLSALCCVQWMSMNLWGVSERVRGERHMHSLFIAKDKRRTKTKENWEKKNDKTARLCLHMHACRHICVRTDRKCSFNFFLLHLLVILTRRTVIPVVFLSSF